MGPTERTDELEVAVSESGGVRLLRLKGELDLPRVARFEQLVAGDSDSEPPTLILDMREVSFIDSSGLRALIMADQRIRADGGRLIVVKGTRVNQVLELTGVAERIELVDEPPAGQPLP